MKKARPANFPAKPPALPERIEAVLQLRELGHEVIRSPWGNREALKEIAMSQDQNHLNHATWECKYHVVFTPKYRKKLLWANQAAPSTSSKQFLGSA